MRYLFIIDLFMTWLFSYWYCYRLFHAMKYQAREGHGQHTSAFIASRRASPPSSALPFGAASITSRLLLRHFTQNYAEQVIVIIAATCTFLSFIITSKLSSFHLYLSYASRVFIFRTAIENFSFIWRLLLHFIIYFVTFDFIIMLGRIIAGFHIS